MPLSSQVYIRNQGTDAFYQPDEKHIHQRMAKLYKLRAKVEKSKEPKQWLKKSINRVLKKEKEKLVNILDSKINQGLIRELNPENLTDKTVISLFESALTRACEIKPGA